MITNILKYSKQIQKNNYFYPIKYENLLLNFYNYLTCKNF